MKQLTEMEQLEQNVKDQLAQERFESIFKWFEGLEREWDADLVKLEKNHRLQLFIVAAQLIIVFVFNSWLGILCFFLWIIVNERGRTIYANIKSHRGKILGGHKVLFLLGLISTDLEDELEKRLKRRRRIVISNPFKRFKEFFERMKQGSTKEKHV